MSSRGQRGTLTQQPDGRWVARYRDGGRGSKRHQRTFAKNQKRKAAKWLRDGLADLGDVAEGETDGDPRPAARQREANTTVSQGIERFLATVDVRQQTLGRMRTQLGEFERTFGDRLVQSLEPEEIQAWRLTVSPGWRADVFRETKRMLACWDRWGWLFGNPAAGIVNKRGGRAEVVPIPWPHILAISDEIDRRYEHVPVLAAGTGLRPEEYLALERRDVDLEGMVIEVRRVWSSGQLMELGADGTKTRRQRRRVPLRQCVADVLAAIPPRIDTRLIVPPARASGSGYMDLGSFRDRFWRPAFTAAGLPYQRPYDARHTYASEAIAAGVGLFELSRFMGTSLREIDDTYGHLVTDSEQRVRAQLDAYDARRPAAAGGRR